MDVNKEPEMCVKMALIVTLARFMIRVGSIAKPLRVLAFTTANNTRLAKIGSQSGSDFNNNGGVEVC